MIKATPTNRARQTRLSSMVRGSQEPLRSATMTPEEFRTAGHALVDWIADQRAAVESRPVRAQVEPGEVRRSFPQAPPETGDQPVGHRGDISHLLSDLDQLVLPGMTHVQHPMNFGWFPANASLASVLGDLASGGLGGLGISWESCPALTEVEEVVCDWMRQLVGLADHWHGTITDTASTGTLTALLVGRERATGLSQNRRGLVGESEPLMVYTTSQAHSSVAKAALLAGFGYEAVREVPVDPTTFAMDTSALADMLAADVESGMAPAAVVASVGTTGVTAIDPIAEIVDAVNDLHETTGIRPWIHVDAALAGSAMLLEDYRHLWAGIDDVDSLCWNPHKWMGTILDTSLLYYRDPRFAQQVLSTNPSYLAAAGSENQATQYRDWGLALGRRFRALKLWFHLRIDGIDTIRERLRADLASTRWLEAEISATPGWEVVAPVPLQTIAVRFTPPDAIERRVDIDAHTRAWIEAINRSGDAFLSPTTLPDGRWVARVSIGAETATRHHVERMWELMQQAAAVPDPNALPPAI